MKGVMNMHKAKSRFERAVVSALIAQDKVDNPPVNAVSTRIAMMSDNLECFVWVEGKRGYWKAKATGKELAAAVDDEAMASLGERAAREASWCEP